MKKLDRFILLFLCCVCIPLYGSSFCEQTFTFLAKGNDVFHIGLDLSGQCCSSQLLTVVIDDEAAALGILDLAEYGKWDQLKEGFKNTRSEEPIQLILEEGSFSSKNQNWKITAPDSDNQLVTLFNEHIQAGGSDAMTFNSEKDRYRLPDIEGANTKLEYMYPYGLYVDYKIDRAFYFPRSGRVLIFTTCPLRAVGMDTMHGFLILRILPDE